MHYSSPPQLGDLFGQHRYCWKLIAWKALFYGSIHYRHLENHQKINIVQSSTGLACLS